MCFVGVVHFLLFFLIIVSLNARGVGKPEKRPAVRKLVRKHKIDCLMFQETKVASHIHRFAREVWGKTRCAWNWVASFGASGGLTTIWNDEVLTMEDVFLADRILAIKFHGVSDGFVWPLANVYGPNVYSKRSDILDILSIVKSQWSVPWVF